MNKLNKWLAFTLVLGCLLLPTGSAHAAGLAEGRVIFGDNYTLESDEILTGDLVVLGGNVTIEEGAIVEGDTVVVGGNVTLDGHVEGSLVIIGGTAKMGESARVDEDLVTVGGWLQREPGSEVGGDVITNLPAPEIAIPNVPSPPVIPEIPALPIPQSPAQVHVYDSPIGQFFRMLGMSLALAVLAVVASLFMQPQIERVSQAVVEQPLIAGSFGLLAVILAPLVLAILALTIILIPVVILAAIVLALAWLFGVIAIGCEVGERFMRATNLAWPYPFVAGFGTFLLMLLVGGLGLLPCLGVMASILLALLGIGGVTLTLFGTRPYPPLAVTLQSDSGQNAQN